MSDLASALDEAQRDGVRCLNVFLNPNGEVQVNINGAEVRKWGRSKTVSQAMSIAIADWRRTVIRNREADDII